MTMSPWAYWSAIGYIVLNVWVYGPTAYETFLEPAVQGAMK